MLPQNYHSLVIKHNITVNIPLISQNNGFYAGTQNSN